MQVAVQLDAPRNPEMRAALRAALLPAVIVFIVHLPSVIAGYAAYVAHIPMPNLIASLSNFLIVIDFVISGWAGYRAAQGTHNAKRARTAGALALLIAGAPYVPADIVFYAIRNSERALILPPLLYAVLLIVGGGLTCLFGALAGWIGYKVARRRGVV